MNRNPKGTKKYNSKKSSSNKYSNNGKRFPKKGNQGAATREDDSRVATNNPEHYASNMTLVEAAARVPFSNPIGGRISLFDGSLINAASIEDLEIDGTEISVPGIMAFDTVPSFGRSVDNQSAINVAANAYWTLIREKYSGSKIGDANDHFTYFMAMSSLYSIINYGQRVFGTMRAFNPKNKYLAQALVKSMGFDYNDLAGNLVSFWGRLNLAINKVSSFAVPASMDFFAHVSSLYLDIYSDGDNLKEQLYLYNPVGFYRYQFDTSETPVHPEGYLKFYAIREISTNEHYLTADEYFQYLEDTLNAVLGIEDLAVFSADVIKAFGDDIITLGEVPYDYRVNIKRDPYVLQQMKNSTIVGYSYNYPDLYQNDSKSILIFEPAKSITYTETPGSAYLVRDFGFCGPRILSVDGPDPNPLEVMEYTRLMVSGTVEQDQENPLVYNCVMETGADVIVGLRVYRWFYKRSGIESLRMFQIPYIWNPMYNQVSNMAGICRLASIVKPFKYAPFVGCCIYNSASSANRAITHIHDFFDYDNYGIVARTTLDEIHRVALYNMLATKAVAKL